MKPFAVLAIVIMVGIPRSICAEDSALRTRSDGKAPDEVERAIASIARTGPQAAGSRDARQSRDRLVECGAEIIPQLLEAMDTTNVVAANWYRTAFDEIVARQLSRPAPRFPVEALQAYAADSERQGRVRRAVVKLLDRLQPGFAATFLSTRFDDPEFRADAVEAALTAGSEAEASGDRELALDQFRRAFEHARAADQVTQAAAKLTALGEKADIITHLGLVTDWYVLGPFDAPEYTGFAAVFPPEEQINLHANYTGKDGKNIRWSRSSAGDALGQLNLMQAIAPVKEAVGYAYSELLAPRDIDAQLRCGADDNCTVWLNGERIFGREQWLNGTRFDRFIVPVHLRSGKNSLLVKVCQGPQHKDPEVPNNWSLQLRFCDATGVGVGLVSVLPTEGKEVPQ